MPVLHPKFLQCFSIRTSPCNLGTHTGELTPFRWFNTVGLGLGFAFGRLRFALRFGLGFELRFGLGSSLRFGLRFGFRFGMGELELEQELELELEAELEVSIPKKVRCPLDAGTGGDERRFPACLATSSGLRARKVRAQKRAEMLRHPCILAGSQQRGQNSKSKPTLGVTMMLLVSQSMGP